MASERSIAKQSAQDIEVSEPASFVRAITQGQDLLDELKENHRHAEYMKSVELGWAGRFLGGEANASITVAFFVIAFGLLAAAGLWFAAANSLRPEFWAHQAELALGIAGTALSYIFGRSGRGSGGKKPKIK